MLACRKCNTLLSSWRTASAGLHFGRYSTSSDVVSTTASSNVPKYPPILDPDFRAKRIRELDQYHEKFKTVTTTVEEKLIGLNMPRIHGFQCVTMKEDNMPPQKLDFIQHCTRTHLIVKDTLPEYYNDFDTPASFMAKELRSSIEEAIRYEFQCIKRTFTPEMKPREKSEIVSVAVMKQINRIITNHLASKLPHIMECQVDIAPRIEAAWMVGGFEQPKIVKKTFDAREHTKHLVGEPYSHYLQYFGDPALTIRSNLPLEPVFPESDASNPSLEVPFSEYDPRVVGYFLDRRRVTNIPGFWPGESSEFGIMSYHKSDHVNERFEVYGPTDKMEAIHGQAMLSSFAWLFAQACYQGFTTYNELTYPFVNQCIVTNGQYWSLYVYQMNTVLMNHHHMKTNPLRNICQGTKPIKLFEGIGDDGKLIAFNDDLLKMIIQMYINTPKERVGVDMKPYLDKNVKYVADIEDVDKRNWLENRYKYLMSNRRTTYLTYEIYLWEKIYKIDNKTRFFEPRRRPFELFDKVNPYHRRLNEHQPRYIPRCLRPDVPKRIGRRAKQYYPDI